MIYSLLHAKTDIQLGQEIGRGGEGVVYTVNGYSERVAKIYSSPPDQHRVQKLQAMTAIGTPSLLRIAAWPIDLIVDKKGHIRGFVMPRIVAHRDIHELYSPKSRSLAFPDANFRFLSHVGANIARAFAVVHEHGQVIGDVNHGNLLVGVDGTVMLIDCDSFQISTHSSVYTCNVGVPLFTAPELQGNNFRNLKRSPNHDLFALAVLLFHLLYMGRHPFAGRYVRGVDMPIEKAISEYRFAYGPDRLTKGMERPPGTIALEVMGHELALYFTKAFSESGSNYGRPDAKTWVTALEKLKGSLCECKVARWHHYPQDQVSCPWCTVESQTAVRLFGQPITVGINTTTIDVARLWDAIVAVPGPGSEPPLPSEHQWNPPPAVKQQKTIKEVRIAFGVVSIYSGLIACAAFTNRKGIMWALASLIFAYAIWPKISGKKQREIEQAYSTTHNAWQATLIRWNQEAKEELFTVKVREMEGVYKKLLNLDSDRTRRLATLEGNKRQLQLKCYLDCFRIEDARIPGIGPSRTAMLESFGIETAGDVDANKIQGISGFGSVITSELLKWKNGHVIKFQYDPNLPIDRRLIDEIDRDVAAKRQTYIVKLRQGVPELTRVSNEVVAARSRLLPMLEQTWNELKIAEMQR